MNDIACPKCQAVNDGSNQFCGKCGAALKKKRSAWLMGCGGLMAALLVIVIISAMSGVKPDTKPDAQIDSLNLMTGKTKKNKPGIEHPVSGESGRIDCELGGAPSSTSLERLDEFRSCYLAKNQTCVRDMIGSSEIVMFSNGTAVNVLQLSALHNAIKVRIAGTEVRVWTGLDWVVK